ncbi:sulfatase-like hydrolase/transferase [Flavivirga aquimarina]|uniref:Sulfatase-like hydrolase/transferase n=1 Tax=Flavivirga aquimarina TaxID=2027862 RepID=A0ABT8W6H2_9FLAO|nr:sulfatase-like hydrolase/transferase [Flavivirga aquimarina]MDO5968706.1 sulfatase-like hydrolase/transferase [Flavivirga aquimarina]
MNRLFFFTLLISITSCINNKDVKKENITIKSKIPNIVYILADDMGYGDLSSLNPESGIQTPHMDKIVKEGVHFTDAHTNSSVCTPTRYGILTGRYAWRSRLKEGVLYGYDKPLIEDDRPTIASYLKTNGYKTACIGKWHLGLGLQSEDSNKPIGNKKGLNTNVDFSKKIKGPNALGFDYSYIIPASLDMPPYVYIENGKVLELPSAYTKGKSQNKEGRGVSWRQGEKAPSFVFENVLNNITKKTVSFIDNQKRVNSPFFIYFSLTAPHTPWLPVGKVVGKSKAGRYGDFVTMVDDAVGSVVDALEKAGKLENTLIIVTSDNGSHWKLQDKKEFAHRANYKFKGQKADIYEGGHRVPYIAQWPGVIPAGLQSNQIMCTTDLFSTLSGILNKPNVESGAEDSYNLWPAYLSNKVTPIREAIVHHSFNGMFSIRKDKWKYTPNLGSGGFTKPKSIKPKANEASGTLYDMVNDPEEKNNLYKDYPEVVKELEQLLKKYKKQGYSNKL